MGQVEVKVKKFQHSGTVPITIGIRSYTENLLMKSSLCVTQCSHNLCVENTFETSSNMIPHLYATAALVGPVSGIISVRLNPAAFAQPVKSLKV